MRLAGKVAVITGAASGIGQATAIRFAQEGARVVVADINGAGGQATVEQVKRQGGQAVFIETNVGREADLARMVEFAVTTYGGLDILHNNAYWTEARPALETTLENWQHTLDVTLRPVWLAAKIAAPHLRARGTGVILNTASIHSIVGVAGYAAYQAAKGGVMSLTRALALELAPEIRVVAILPGAIDTPAAAIGDPAALDQFIASLPLKRIGRPEEVANLALFLASDEAAYITGTGVVIDGGFTAQ
ncbi:MAG: short-chain dehydrogenase [Chloroflexota bacterium]|nr:MAG: short-chain dehydrogenase [Chloroflexota bacterium]